MNILIPESTSPMGAELAASARELGHAVFACHRYEGGDARCVADRGDPCPLDAQNIDVTVLSGHAGGDTLTCAQRRRVPVAFVFRPDRRSLSAAIDDATDDLAAHARIARAAMQQALSFRGIDADGTTATVRRRGGGLLVNLHLPAGIDPSDGNAVAVVVHDALRRYDSWATAVDIAVA
jgi:hypothetical protein